MQYNMHVRLVLNEISVQANKLFGDISSKYCIV